MKFEHHLREFLDNSIDDAEACELAIGAITGNLRQIKLDVAARLWGARQLGADDAKASAAALGMARLLKSRYEFARAEYDRLTGLPSPEQTGQTDLHVIAGGRPDLEAVREAPGAPSGSA
ncbi:MAG: hypothetical protein QF554_11295 [Dehalococcoidia bacterium]|jgi:hypothetical protein|nr:hypothetical protein [Dehalococcoidia bacterium]